MAQHYNILYIDIFSDFVSGELIINYCKDTMHT